MRKQQLRGRPAAENAGTTRRASTFTVRLHPTTADRLAELCNEFRDVTPEAIISEVVSDAMRSAADRREPYRVDLAEAAADRARSMRRRKEWRARNVPVYLAFDLVEAITRGAKAAGEPFEEFASRLTERLLSELAATKGGAR